MKKVLLALLFVAGITGANAQVTTAPTTKVKLNVILNPVLSIEIGTPGSGAAEGYADVVNLEYTTAEQYRTGVEKKITGHLKVTSIGSGFKVYASASSPNLNRVGGDNNVMAGDLVSVVVGAGPIKNIQSLGAKAGKVGSAAEEMTAKLNGTSGSTVNQLLDVTYKSAPLTDALVASLLANNNKGKATYTVDVLYSVIAD